MLKNELLSYVKMWGRRPCRLNISQQLCCRFFPVREFLVVKAEESENLKATIKPPPTDKDWYLYGVNNPGRISLVPLSSKHMVIRPPRRRFQSKFCFSINSSFDLFSSVSATSSSRFSNEKRPNPHRRPTQPPSARLADCKRNAYMEAELQCSNAIQSMERKLRIACHASDANIDNVLKV
ncbi:unnamed protein product, partial [Prunus brigantina]